MSTKVSCLISGHEKLAGNSSAILCLLWMFLVWKVCQSHTGNFERITEAGISWTDYSFLISFPPFTQTVVTIAQSKPSPSSLSTMLYTLECVHHSCLEQQKLQVMAEAGCSHIEQYPTEPLQLQALTNVKSLPWLLSFFFSSPGFCTKPERMV